MKWQHASISLTGLTAAIIVIFILWPKMTRQPDNLFTPEFINQNVQLGFYDMLSEKQEIYDPAYQLQGKTVLLTLTSPQNSELLAKISMQPRAHTAAGLLYHYEPLLLQLPGQAQMLQGMLNYFTHHGIAFNRVAFEQNQIIVSPSGMILSGSR